MITWYVFITLCRYKIKGFKNNYWNKLEITEIHNQLTSFNYIYLPSVFNISKINFKLNVQVSEIQDEYHKYVTLLINCAWNEMVAKYFSYN